jgi:hypothetical protein
MNGYGIGELKRARGVHERLIAQPQRVNHLDEFAHKRIERADEARR